MHHLHYVVNDKVMIEVISSNATLFISRNMGITTNGTTQLRVSATTIRHLQVVHRTYQIAILHMCSAIWMV
jgi:hypothetical protein